MLGIFDLFIRKEIVAMSSILISTSFGAIYGDNISARFTESRDSEVKFFLSRHVPLDPTTKKIKLPEGCCRVKLDIGLSYSAPMSQYWLSRESDLVVFGFEPNLTSVRQLLRGAIKRDVMHGEPLDKAYIGRRFFLLPCALGLSDNLTTDFYITADSCGCCSIYEPSAFDVSEKVIVPIFSLHDFFSQFPFERCPVIEYIKIDAQGADLDIVKSAGSFLRERVVYVTIEAENGQYKGTNNSEEAINEYMTRENFERVYLDCVQDPTYINKNYLEYAVKHHVQIYQKG